MSGGGNWRGDGVSVGDSRGGGVCLGDVEGTAAADDAMVPLVVATIGLPCNEKTCKVGHPSLAGVDPEACFPLLRTNRFPVNIFIR